MRPQAAGGEGRAAAAAVPPGGWPAVGSCGGHGRGGAGPTRQDARDLSGGARRAGGEGGRGGGPVVAAGTREILL